MTTLGQLRRFARFLGIDVRRRREVHEWRLAAWLAAANVKTVLDVGANDGGFARTIRQAGYEHEILSFEPIREIHARLLRHARRDPRWSVFQLAAGSEDGVASINVAGNRGASSSLLEMTDRHVAGAPGSVFVRQERIQVARLDDVSWRGGRLADQARDDADGWFMKVDVQGFERAVLDGAAGLLSTLRGVQLELALVELYRGSWLLAEALEAMGRLGFQPRLIGPGFSDWRTGESLQVDCVFARAGETHGPRPYPRQRRLVE